MVDDVRLRDIARRDRLDELTFEIPLVGGDAPTATLHVAAVADLLEEHLPADDPVARYAPELRDPALSGVLRGYLTGSLDLVFRLPGDRFVLADYKTNKLATPGGDADVVALPARRAAGGDGGGALPAAGAPLRRGAAPLSALAAARATTPTCTSGASSTCSCAG